MDNLLNRFRTNTYFMQTNIKSFLQHQPNNFPFNANNKSFIKPKSKKYFLTKDFKDIILNSNKIHNNGKIKCQYCKQNVRYTGRQKKNCSIMFDYVYPKEVFKTEEEYYSFFNCVASCRRCHLLKKNKPYNILVTELFKKFRLQIAQTYEVPMILD